MKAAACMSPIVTVSLGLSFLCLVAACDRTHMSPNFGVAERNAFQSQVIHPDAGGEQKPVQPLDPEEAAIVARRYQRSMGTTPAGEPDTPRSPMLVVPPPTSGAIPLELR